MALPAEPRQKMVNLMYLVLTALLALNVSAEILNAFKTVEKSLSTTNNTINASTQTIMASFEEKLADPASKTRAEEWMPRAQKAVALTADLNKYIESVRSEILTAAGFDPVKNGDSTFKEDNQDIATRIMVEEGKGKQLYDRLVKYKKDMAALVDDPLMQKKVTEYLKQIDLSFTPNPHSKHESWEATYFHMVPTVAATTMLTKFQNDVKTSENHVVSLFHEQVGAVKVRFTKFAALIAANSNYIMPGQELEVKAGLGAFSDQEPTIMIAGQRAAFNAAEGMASYKIKPTALGTHSIPVVIRYLDQDGKPQEIPKTITYTVGQASAAISLDKMNVLYIGVDNPVTIAASGGGDDRISVSINGGGGSLNKVGNGKYSARVSNVTDNCTITVMVDGKPAGSSNFRVRTIPDPVATIGGYPSGANINAGAFRAQAGVGAYIKDFPFELKYEVVSFVISGDDEATGDIIEAPVQGNTWDAKAAKLVKNVKSGQLITVDQIKARGPDGRVRSLPSLVYYIK